MENIKSKYSICSGPSMFPTLKSGDGLIISKYTNNTEIKIGDIIVYPHPHKSIDVVHRIITIKYNGAITRGDNNNKIDPYIVNFKDITGKVTGYKRGSLEKKMLNGYLGYLRHKYLIAQKTVKPICKKIPKKYYALLCKIKLLNSLHPLFNLKVLIVTRNGEKQYYLMYKNKTIGKKNANNKKWSIIFPYGLFIDTEKLGK